MDNMFFNGDILTVSEDTLNPRDIIVAITEVLDECYGSNVNAGVRAEASVLYDADDLIELDYILEDVEAELEALANLHGYTFGPLDGDGAHFVLAPLVDHDA